MAAAWLFVALLVAVSAQQRAGCPQQFSGRCVCGETRYDGSLKFVVNCTDEGFPNSSMLEFLPSQTQVLIFTGNQIPQLPWNVLGTLLDHENLRVIDMSNNGIEEIKGKSYHRVSSVERLILNHNNIYISGEKHHARIFSNFVNLKELHLTNAFADNVYSGEKLVDLQDVFVNSNLSKLLKLHLEQNEIGFFSDPLLFCDLPSLMDLHLGDNQLPDLNVNLTCLQHLRFLDLERNKMRRLSGKTLALLDQFPTRGQNLTVDLSGNPFSCDCGIQDLYSWLQTSHVFVRNKQELRCTSGTPHSNTGQRVVELKQIQCAMLTPPDHSATAAVLAVLILVLCVLLGAVVYTHRGWVASKIHDVSRKVQYSSIGKTEEQEMDV